MNIPSAIERTGVVVIGRNEGARLPVCIKSALIACTRVIYVDSNSTDDSVESAKALGVEVVFLAPPGLTAARARQAGFERLFENFPSVDYVQFVDGDCELNRDWLRLASNFLEQNPDVAVVSGRRRERNPQDSVFNRLCDQEWSKPSGETDSCGGDTLMRAQVFCHIGGYNPTLIAGEDPEICLRVLDAGHRIVRLAVDMTLHDAAMHHFWQWWQRTRRTGWAYAAVGYLHRSRLKTQLRIWKTLIWGLGMPFSLGVIGALTLLFAGRTYWWTGLPFLLTPIVLYLGLAAKVFLWRCKCGDNTRFAAVYAFFCVLGKPVEAIGMLQFCMDQIFRRGPSLIEYK